MSISPCVLLAEDDDEVRDALADGLRRSGNEVIDVPDGKGVQAYIDDCAIYDAAVPRVHALVTDLWMPGVDGLGLLEHMRDVGLDLPTVVVTACADPQTQQAARDLGAVAVLTKPIELGELQRVVREVIDEKWPATVPPPDAAA
jgi:CheY-like chemotaxis protein